MGQETVPLSRKQRIPARAVYRRAMLKWPVSLDGRLVRCEEKLRWSRPFVSVEERSRSLSTERQTVAIKLAD